MYNQNKRSIFHFTICLAMFILFHNKIMEWYDAYFVVGIMSIVDGNEYWNWIAVTIISVLTIFIAKRYFGKNAISKVSFIWSVFIFILYAYYRYFSKSYIFYPEASVVKYADYLSLLQLCITILALTGYRSDTSDCKTDTTNFLTDTPISDEVKDIYNRKDIARRMAVRIQTLEPGSSSLAIGIIGNWGIGKTSFMNLVKNNLDLQRCIVISFNPWKSSSSANVIEDFFRTLISEFKKYDIKLSSDLKSYAASLAAVDDNFFSKILKYLIFFSSDRKEQSSNYTKIDNTLQKIKKRVVIIIDDLDRLDKQELIEVLKLIRNTANFTNTIYIAAYAKEYIEQAIKDFNPYQSERFIEKIFQFEFHVPNINSHMLRNKLIEILQNGLISASKDVISKAVNIQDHDERVLVNDFIRSPRDVTRFSNSIIFGYDKICKEINFADLFLIELLRLKFYKIYSNIAENLELFFYYDNIKCRLRNDNELNDGLVEIMASLMPNNKNQETTKSEPIFHKFLTDTDIKETEKSTILNLITCLLDEKRTEESNSRNIDYRRFIYNFRKEKYFTIHLLEHDISSIEFEEARKGDFSAYRLKVIKWINDGSLPELENMISRISDFTTKEEWSNHLLIWILILKEKIKNGENPMQLPLGQCMQTLTFPVLYKKGTHFFPDGISDYREYVINIFTDAQSPYIAEACILSLLSAPTFYSSSFPITRTDCVKLLTEYFEKYCNEHNEINREFKKLYYSIKSNQGIPSFTNEIENKFIAYYKLNLKEKDLKEFINISSEGKFVINNEWILTFFDSIEQLIEFIKASKNIDIKSDIVAEFFEFIENWNTTTKDRAIDFNFRKITFEH